MIKLQYYRSYHKPGEFGLPLRHVFTTSRKDVFVVLKQVTNDVQTLKIWKGASIAKTASFWSTSEQFVVPTPDIESLKNQMIELFELLN